MASETWYSLRDPAKSSCQADLLLVLNLSHFEESKLLVEFSGSLVKDVLPVFRQVTA
jgi:hypothetical protein